MALVWFEGDVSEELDSEIAMEGRGGASEPSPFSASCTSVLLETLCSNDLATWVLDFFLSSILSSVLCVWSQKGEG